MICATCTAKHRKAKGSPMAGFCEACGWAITVRLHPLAALARSVGAAPLDMMVPLVVGARAVAEEQAVYRSHEHWLPAADTWDHPAPAFVGGS